MYELPYLKRTTGIYTGLMLLLALVYALVLPAAAADDPVRIVRPFDSRAVPNAWGSMTNGFRAGLSITYTNPTTVGVFLQLNGPARFSPTNSQTVASGDRWHGSIYFRPTNSFVGPIELRDGAGKLVRLKKPEINKAAAYPAVLSLSAVEAFLSAHYSYYSGPGLPPIDTGGGWQADFVLSDYFQMKKPGVYRLTVWPMVYMRRTPNSDLCKRVDIPPVTLSVPWPGAEEGKAE